MAAGGAKENRKHCGPPLLFWMVLQLILNNSFLVFGERKLRMVHLVYRHGDRSPVRLFPTDPHKSHWPQGLGQLTQEGMRQEYRLGKFLRNRYMKIHKLLNESYIRHEVYCRSSDKDRTLMSAETQLAGLYPPFGRQRWNSSLSWQPIPVHTVQRSKDFLLRPSDSCPKYNQEVLKERQRSDELMHLQNKYKGFLEWISSVTGFTVTTDNTWIVYDTLFCEKANNLSLPVWVNETVFQTLQKIQRVRFNFNYHSDTLARLSGGPLLGDMVQHMIGFRKRDKNLKKMYIYSAHDTTVMAFLSALRVYNDVPPAYSTVAMLELYSDDKKNPAELTVEIWYRYGQNDTATRLKLKNCGVRCPLDQFIKETLSVDPDDVKAVCGLNETICVKNVIYKGFVAAVALVSLILVLVLLWLCVKRCRRPPRIRTFELVDEHGGTTQLLADDNDDEE